MAGPGGQEVGRLSVRVLPDTSNFATSLQQYLDRIERRAQMTVQVEPDMDRFSTDVRTQLQAMERRYQLNIRANAEGIRNEVQAQIRAAQAGARIRVRMDVDRDSLGRLGGALGSLGGAAGSTFRRVGRLGLALRLLAGSLPALPAVAALTSHIASMGPAAAVAAPAIMSLATAGGALAIGMQNVGTALSDTTASLEKLTPEAASFVRAVRSMKDEWGDLQKSVQSKLFKGLGETLREVGSQTLPVLERGFKGAATQINAMGKGILNTAGSLAESGALGKAMSGANTGLRNMRKIPGQILNAFVKLSAGAAPAFDRVTQAVARGMSSLTEKINKGLESGTLAASINAAIDRVKEFGAFLGDLGGIFSNVFGPAAQAGAGFFTVLSGIVEKVREFTAGAAFQSSILEVFKTLHAVGRAVSEVLGSALRAVGPLLQTITSTLGPAIRGLLTQITPVITQVVSALGGALGPVIGVVSEALAFLAPIIGKIVTQLGDTLVPILNLVGPLLGEFAGVVLSALQPALSAIPALIAPILAAIQKLYPLFVQVQQQLMASLGPALKQLGTLLGELMVALTPLVSALMDLAVPAFKALMPVIAGIMGIVGKLVGLLVGALSVVIRNVVIPIVKALAALLRGDFSKAWQHIKGVLADVSKFFGVIWEAIKAVVKAGVRVVVQWFADMGRKALERVTSMAASVVSSITRGMARFASAVSRGVSRVVGFVKGLPGKAKAALGNLGSLLKDSGKALIQGFIDGIKNMIGAAKNAASSVVGAVRDFFPFSPAKEGPFSGRGWVLYSGRSVAEGFADGIADYERLASRASLSLASVATGPLVNATVNGDDVERGLQPGDTIALTVDGQTTLEAVIQRGASATLNKSLAGPLRRGRLA